MLARNETGDARSINPVRLIGTHACVIGNTGSGKTHTIRKILEDTWTDAVHVVFDPEQEFHTLRQGKPYVIVGGPHGDMPIDTGRAADLARHVVETRTSVIVQWPDSADLEEQRAYIAAFLTALMALPRDLWKPVFVVIDEAHRYAPQAGGATSLGPICTLMSQGRKRGFTGILATQRFAKLNKSASSEANTWLIGRVGQVTDMRVAANNLGFPVNSPEANGLRHLKPGQFWGFGVALADQPELLTVEPTATQHLALGQTWKPQPMKVRPLPRASVARTPTKPGRPNERAGAWLAGAAVAGFLVLVCALPFAF
jgi:hypothetical protein